MLAPFTPHLCEEMWENLGYKTFISLAEWPQSDEALTNSQVEEMEKYIIELHSDTQNIINATGLESSRIFYYTSSDWKWDVYLAILKHASEGRVNSDNLIREVMKDDSIRKEGDKAVKLIRRIWEVVRKMPDDMIKVRLQTSKVDELELIMNAFEFYRKEFNAEIQVYAEDSIDKYDPMTRSETTIPYRPAIYLE
jgi:leucyl-tRNA synthetase